MGSDQIFTTIIFTGTVAPGQSDEYLSYLTFPAPAGVVFVQVILQGVPTSSHPHHHVASQDLKRNQSSVGGQSELVIVSFVYIPQMLELGDSELTLTKIRTLVSPILYFPSDTLIMGN